MGAGGCAPAWETGLGRRRAVFWCAVIVLAYSLVVAAVEQPQSAGPKIALAAPFVAGLVLLLPDWRQR